MLAFVGAQKLEFQVFSLLQFLWRIEFINLINFPSLKYIKLLDLSSSSIQFDKDTIPVWNMTLSHFFTHSSCPFRSIQYSCLYTYFYRMTK